VTTVRLQARHLPYDAPRLLAFVGAHAVAEVETWRDGAWTTSLRLPGGPAVAVVTAAADGVHVALHGVSAVDHPVALQRLRDVLGLDQSVSVAVRVLARDPRLADLLGRRPGLRVPGALDGVELLLRTIIGQQVSLAGARVAAGRLAAAAGEPLPRDLARPGLSLLWPTPSAVAALDPAAEPGPDGVRALAMPATRRRSVVGAAAAAVACGGLPARADLLALPGIGPWTADYVDLRARADPDVFLPTDLAARRVVEPWVADQVGDGGRVGVADRARLWAPHRSLALLHVWAHYLDL
jgi:AraC family transcriptional regulator of adaptative response / DNA-3-methyladenine glycosylase II